MIKQTWKVDTQNPLVIRPCRLNDEKTFQETQEAYSIEEGKVIASVSDNQENPEAISKLIVAAPEMYDALQALDSLIDFGEKTGNSELDEAYRKAKSALKSVEY